MSASDKTEKATPKRREEARKKGQVARSTDLNGSVVLIAALGALAAFGPMIVDGLGESMRGLLAQIANPGQVSAAGLRPLLETAGLAVAVATIPVALACLLAGLGVNLAQVGFRIAVGLGLEFGERQQRRCRLPGQRQCRAAGLQAVG